VLLIRWTLPILIKTTIVNYQGQDVFLYRYYGSGKAIFLAFDFYDTIPETGKILANAIAWGGQNALASWIHMSLTNDQSMPKYFSCWSLHSWLTVFLPELIMQHCCK